MSSANRVEGVAVKGDRGSTIAASELERNTFSVCSNVGWVENGTSMPQELLFELRGARVTPHIATFGGTSSYQIAR